jgi:putative copper resistance protein D
MDPFFIIPAGVALWLYLAGVRKVNRAHPGSPYPVRRLAYFLFGMGVMTLAIISPLAAYDTELFAVHMWQHVLLTMVATPFILLGTPITLAMRVASPKTRKETLLPILHSRVLKVLTFPVIGWLLFAVTMWGSHFSPLFNAALENIWLHRLEHFWYLVAAFLFWWPIIGQDFSPWKMNHPARLLYLFIQMPQNAFLALAIDNAETVRYAHYATVDRQWGPSPLRDQELAGITMWVGGDLLFLVAMAIVAYGWVKKEELEGKRQDRQQARARAQRRAEAAAAAASADAGTAGPAT